MELARQLFEKTGYTYKEIAAQAGVTFGLVGHWKKRYGWVRCAGAPVPTVAVEGERAGLKLGARELRRRAQALAERFLDELERRPHPDPKAIARALDLVRRAKRARKHAANGRPKPRRPRPAARGGPSR